MASTVICDGETTGYQKDRLGLLLNPSELMTFVQGKLGSLLRDIVLFSGTMGMIDGEFFYGECFSAERIIDHLDRRL